MSNPPPQRYVEIMIAGARHFGVNEDYIKKLETIPSKPRKVPADFLTFKVPDDVPNWTMDDVVKGDGLEGRPAYTHLNGKVLQEMGPLNEGMGAIFVKL